MGDTIRYMCVVFVAIWLHNLNVAEPCVKIDACSCVMSKSKRTFSLWALAGTYGIPRFTNIPSQSEPGVSYFYNPCVAFTETDPNNGCTNMAVCQKAANLFYPAGTQESVVMSGDSDSYVIFTYTAINGGTIRASMINVSCDPNTEADFIAQGEEPRGSLNYFFQLKSKYACMSTQTTTLPFSTTAITTPTPRPSPSPGFFSLKTAIILLSSILFCLILLVVLVLIGVVSIVESRSGPRIPRGARSVYRKLDFDEKPEVKSI